MTHDKNCAFYQDGPCNCWMSRVSPCGAETSETTTPEPASDAEEPVTVLRGALDLGEINRLAADCAAGPEDRVGTIFRLATQTVPALTARIAELEADVRALGGDPDRMVDPRDHETGDDFAESIRQRMRVALTPAGGAHVFHLADVATEVALSVARPLLDGMTSGSEEMAELRQRCAELAKPGPAPEVREVPAGEAREAGWVAVDPDSIGRYHWLQGDEVEVVHRGVVNGVDWDERYFQFEGDERRHPYGSATAIRRRPRAVSALPDQPGAVGTATVRGVKGVRVFRVDDDNGPLHWTSAVLVNGHRWFEDDDLADFLPDGAGVDGGGKR